MANSASDARATELELRKKLLQDRAVDVMIAVGSNFFYTVTLPCTLWFIDKAKAKLPPCLPSPLTPLPLGEGEKHSPISSPSGRGKGEGAEHGRRNKDEGLLIKGARYGDTVLFIDARNIYQQIDRAHREFLPEQIEFIANIVRLYRGEDIETMQGSEKLVRETFPEGRYQDVAGLCKVTTLKDIEEQGWSLNPGRYVGVMEEEQDEFDFRERLEKLNEELETLNAEAKELEEQISENVAKILEVKNIK